MLNIVLFGPPGAGKGTQSKKLRSDYGLVHISTGELFRKHIIEGTSIGIQVQEYIAEGMLVPDEITLLMIEEQILAYYKDCKGFLFDGFPRTVAQAQALDRKLEEYNSSLSLVLSLDVPREELHRRIKKRGLEENRIDDQDESSVLTRFDLYNSETLPVKTYYENQGKFIKISGIDHIDLVLEKIKEIVDRFIIENSPR
ncbi:MAG: adenylate kinase [Bacteroidetes bacterium]|nr:adenylate kinase [Bacteroidota bacterium]